jgi:hypothetical protein
MLEPKIEAKSPELLLTDRPWDMRLVCPLMTVLPRKTFLAPYIVSTHI